MVKQRIINKLCELLTTSASEVSKRDYRLSEGAANYEEVSGDQMEIIETSPEFYSLLINKEHITEGDFYHVMDRIKEINRGYGI
jgi:hypothetical protein